MINFCFNEESDYSEENMCDTTIKSSASPFFNHFSLTVNRKKRVVMKTMRKKINIQVSVADLLHIRIKNLDWCKCRNCKNETREIGCL